MSLHDFLKESLAIEGIYRDPTPGETQETADFLQRPLTIYTVIALQQVYAPGKPLRTRSRGMNVRVGDYIAPPGGCKMQGLLRRALHISDDPWIVHVEFEKLHPFMDGNGRTGRAVWAHKMLKCGQDPFALSFLHRFYYQTLAHQ